jgi:serine protease inhibitor
MRSIYLLFAALCFAPVPATAQDKTPPMFTDFGLQLLEAITSSDTATTFISPLSVGLAYAALLPGTTGPTRDEIRRGIGVSGLTDSSFTSRFALLMPRLTGTPNVTLRIGISLWVQVRIPAQAER